MKDWYNAKKIVSITDYGAVANSELQTKRIQTAIDDCFLEGGGTVIIPPGTFWTGGIRLRSDITIYLKKGAVLKGSGNPEDYFGYLNDSVEPLNSDLITNKLWTKPVVGEERDYSFMHYPGSRWNNALIKAVYAKNISIIGEEGAYLDGSNCFDEQNEEGYRGPHCINMHHCENIHLEGYTVKDSANWAHLIYFANNITAKNVKVLAGHDGFHFGKCSNVIVSGCKLYTGDDCIAGFANENVMVENCELNSACSALRFGGMNAIVNQCHIYGPCKYFFRGSLSDDEKRNPYTSSLENHRKNMLSVFTYYSDYSLEVTHIPQNIVISNCNIENADKLLHYNFSGNELWQSNVPLGNIMFENIKAKNMRMPNIAYGDNDRPFCAEFKNIDYSFEKSVHDVPFLHVCNYERIIIENVNVRNLNCENLIYTWSNGDIEFKNLRCDIDRQNLIKNSIDTFDCNLI